MKFTHILLIIVILNFSCSKFITIDPPPNRVLSDLAFSDDIGATATMVGIYSDIMQLPKPLSGLSGIYGSCLSDELISGQLPYKDFYENEVLSSSLELNSFWSFFYATIYNANSVISGLEKSKTVSERSRNQLTGEALFVRALNYFYLVNYFGPVPLAVSTDYKVNATLPRAATKTIYSQVIKDLQSAIKLLPETYVTPERARPNQWTAQALLSRIYLYTGQWKEAEATATAIIQSGTYSLESSLQNVFLKNSNETIWQLTLIPFNNYTWDAIFYIPYSTTTIPNFYLQDNIKDGAQKNDLRLKSWIGPNIINGQDYAYPYKYRNDADASTKTEYYVVFRLAEQYLIRAEARAQQNNTEGGAKDLNMLHPRAGLPDLPIDMSKVSFMDTLKTERKAELFCEWGHRWFDLKRWGITSSILAPVKGSNWQAADTLLPIPEAQISANPALLHIEGN